MWIYIKHFISFSQFISFYFSPVFVTYKYVSLKKKMHALTVSM